MSEPAAPAAPATGEVSVERPHIFWWLSILSGMGLLTLLVLSDRAFALWSTQITTLFPRPLLGRILVAALLAHVGEGLYAGQLARQLGLGSPLGWTVQTLFLGYPSLRLLLRRR